MHYAVKLMLWDRLQIEHITIFDKIPDMKQSLDRVSRGLADSQHAKMHVAVMHHIRILVPVCQINYRASSALFPR